MITIKSILKTPTINKSKQHNGKVGIGYEETIFRKET
jgi:hypothetical protein